MKRRAVLYCTAFFLNCVMLEIIAIVLLLFILVALILLVVRVFSLGRIQTELPDILARALEEKHRLMLSDLHDGLNKQGDRMVQATLESSERLREIVAQELKLTREAMQGLQLAQHAGLAATREEMLKQLSVQGRADQELIQSTMKRSTEMLTQTIEGLTKSTDSRLEQISGKVAERLDEGFKKTNETFTNVMTRLATIDEAQKKIDGLTTNVVSLQHLLGDKRSRGAFGEVQLEGLVRNILPPDAYSFQEKLSNGNRVDCLLILPPPTGKVPVDAKFPLENYHRMLDQDLAESDKLAARKQFKLDIKNTSKTSARNI